MSEIKPPATPEEEIKKLREAQSQDRKKVEAVQQRIKDRKRRIEETQREAKLVDRLKQAGVVQPWLVITEADRASDHSDIPEREFRAMSLVILKKETGIPQRAVFGCDHGPHSGPPYCHQAVNHDTGSAFLRALHSDVWAYMNGVHWTQTTWYEKVYRVEKLSGDLTDAAAHLRVCLGDLALLRDAYGVAEAFERYNGSGPAADAYRIEAMSMMPWALNLIGD